MVCLLSVLFAESPSAAAAVLVTPSNSSSVALHVSGVTTGAAVSPPAQPTLASIASGGLLISLTILLCSGVPAASIWRSSHLHKNSYLYVLALCMIDCAVGASIFLQVAASLVLLVTRGAVPGLVCIVTEALTTSSMNAVSLLMAALAKDRLVSLQYPLRYPMMVPRATVWRDVRLAAAYGAGHALVFVVARLEAGHATRQFGYCNTLDWLLEPRYRTMAGITVLANVVLDGCTVFYNCKILYCASRRRVVAPHTSTDGTKQAVIRKQTKIFFFTLKLACLFVGCSLPYKAFMLLHATGADVPRPLFNLLGFIRSLYHIMDGWTFCFNAELLETLRAMLGCAI